MGLFGGTKDKVANSFADFFQRVNLSTLDPLSRQEFQDVNDVLNNSELYGEDTYVYSGSQDTPGISRYGSNTLSDEVNEGRDNIQSSSTWGGFGTTTVYGDRGSPLVKELQLAIGGLNDVYASRAYYQAKLGG